MPEISDKLRWLQADEPGLTQRKADDATTDHGEDSLS